MPPAHETISCAAAQCLEVTANHAVLPAELLLLPQQESLITAGEFLVNDGNHRVSGNARMNASGSASIKATGFSRLRCWGDATAIASEHVYVFAGGRAKVRAFGQAVVDANDCALVTAADRAQVTAKNAASIFAYDDAIVDASGRSVVHASGRAVVRAGGCSKINVFGENTIYACDNSEVHIYAKNGCTVYLCDAARVVRLEGGAKIIARHGSSAVNGGKLSLQGVLT